MQRHLEAKAGLAVAQLPYPALTPTISAGTDFDPRTSFGAVDAPYAIGKTPVTNQEYVEFLNAVAPNGMINGQHYLGLYESRMGTDANGGIDYLLTGAPGAFYACKPGRERHPVNFVSWYDALRFVNWLHNGKPTADNESEANKRTEDGAYTLKDADPATGVPTNGSG